MTILSSGDKYSPDGSLQRLLDLNGEVMEVGEGFWVKFVVQAVTPTAAKPHGIDYSLCLFSPDDVRLVCFDNAHPVKEGPGRSAKLSPANDHVHDGYKVVPYAYEDAEKLMGDFWEAVEDVLERSRAKGE